MVSAFPELGGDRAEGLRVSNQDAGFAQSPIAITVARVSILQVAHYDHSIVK